tara:strand:+ start:192 stop:407 length:216 start_codon:yes stop_codon:yes gene_type:complete
MTVKTRKSLAFILIAVGVLTIIFSPIPYSAKDGSVAYNLGYFIGVHTFQLLLVASGVVLLSYQKKKFPKEV